MSSTPDRNLIETLRQHCQSKPRASIKRSFSSDNRFRYNRLGFLLDFAYFDLSSFARFNLDETPALMTLRCGTSDFETLQEQHPNICTYISKSKWQHPRFPYPHCKQWGFTGKRPFGTGCCLILHQGYALRRLRLRPFIPTASSEAFWQMQ